jgi:hypothetical protein
MPEVNFVKHKRKRGEMLFFELMPLSDQGLAFKLHLAGFAPKCVTS